MPVSTGMPSGEASDAALVLAIGTTRDKQAFQLLFARYAPKLKAHFAQAGRSGLASDDLVQEVMLSVWTHAASYKPELAAVSTWIFRIARNRFIDVVRKQRHIAVEPEVSDSLPAEAVSLDEDISTQQLSVRVVVAMSSLPAEQAAVLRASYFQHESASQTAARLGIPIGTVKSRLRAALTHLQRSVVGAAREANLDGGEP
jgi:RNA polymerase sigma factor (sigma-70 family)